LNLIGNNYLGEKAWEKLGIPITDLPPIPDDLIKEAERLETQNKQPCLVLDLGKSIYKRGVVA